MSNADLIARLGRIMVAPGTAGVSILFEAADALTAQASEVERTTNNRDMWKAQCARQAAQIEALRADAAVLKCHVDSLRDALTKVLDTRNKEAKAALSYQTARENFSDDTDERKAHERAMLAACDAEREARTLLLTLKDMAGKAVTP